MKTKLGPGHVVTLIGMLGVTESLIKLDRGGQAAGKAERAMAWLRHALAAGYKDAANIRKDKDLDALRSRDDFKKAAGRSGEGQAQRQVKTPLPRDVRRQDGRPADRPAAGRSQNGTARPPGSCGAGPTGRSTGAALGNRLRHSPA
jgi:hypothetical protein